IVWVYDIIWFIPLDFVKFGLQMAFARSLGGAKPFNGGCDNLFSKICKRSAVSPEHTVTIRRTSHRQSTRPSLNNGEDISTRLSSRLQRKSVIDKIDEFVELGASYYTPHADILSGL
ncbi:unnamed protein product, partial [Rotaria magnacalcarata]